MKKFIVRTLGVLLLLALIVAAYTWFQVRRVRGRLAVEAPLSIEAPAPNRAQLRGVQERLLDDAKAGGGVMRLSSADATVMLRSALRERQLIGTLRAERKRLMAALSGLPDPLGLLADLHLDQVDLKKLDGDVAYAGDRVVARLTGPYGEGPQQGKHLNLLVEASGTWRRGQTPAFALHRLEVGGLDLLGIVPYGGVIRGQVEAAIKGRTARTRLGPLAAISIEGGQGVLTFAPGTDLGAPMPRALPPVQRDPAPNEAPAPEEAPTHDPADGPTPADDPAPPVGEAL